MPITTFTLRHDQRFLLSTLALALCTAGCSSNLPCSVKGTVKMDGEPLKLGSVSFHPVSGSGAVAIGTIAGDGSYAVATGAKEGMQPGEYVVTVVAAEPPKPSPDEREEDSGKLLTPPKYGDSGTSPRRFTVTEGENVIPIEITTDGGP